MTKTLEEQLVEALKARMSLTPEQMHELSASLDALIQPRIEVFERALKDTNNKVDTLQEQVRVLEEELTGDRQNLGTIKVKTAAIEERVKNIFETVIALPTEVIEKVTHNLNKQEDRLGNIIEEKVHGAVTETVMGLLEPKNNDFQIKTKKSLWQKVKPYLQRN